MEETVSTRTPCTFDNDIWTLNVPNILGIFHPLESCGRRKRRYGVSHSKDECDAPVETIEGRLTVAYSTHASIKGSDSIENSYNSVSF